MKFNELKVILSKAAKEAGIVDYEIYYQRGSSLSADALKDELDSFTSSSEGGVCFRCVVDGLPRSQNRKNRFGAECLASLPPNCEAVWDRGTAQAVDEERDHRK